ncbi:hypothetical protein SK128_021233 [Halocaridina rubra]|uniref:Uncharacterized protein n=1 Tax=Halocaridina rubra TaxID=373956 RepID=A0AAN8ZTC1_HALRR
MIIGNASSIKTHANGRYNIEGYKRYKIIWRNHYRNKIGTSNVDKRPDQETNGSIQGIHLG